MEPMDVPETSSNHDRNDIYYRSTRYQVATAGAVHSW